MKSSILPPSTPTSTNSQLTGNLSTNQHLAEFMWKKKIDRLNTVSFSKFDGAEENWNDFKRQIINTCRNLFDTDAALTQHLDLTKDDIEMVYLTEALKQMVHAIKTAVTSVQAADIDACGPLDLVGVWTVLIKRYESSSNATVRRVVID